MIPHVNIQLPPSDVLYRYKEVRYAHIDWDDMDEIVEYANRLV